ncbi:WAT1-related protein At3g30340-like [Beta vulgaris subsp. vulgaris]|uniref:WAT1-related protein At3g30340-like n=1 Tax=Beta vulgaris subsp. vulgaris TaxID=3555 RepID=UPI002036A80C|nr:WAT1-related protein At3g30340-like [Beta vulgaris subsp. vulgaris]
MNPVFTFLLALPLRQESVNLRTKHGMAKVLGSLTCIGGVILLIFYRRISLNKATNYSGKPTYNASNLSMVTKVGSKEEWIVGSIYLLLSIICWSGWFLMQSRIGKIYGRKYSSTALMSAFGVAQSAILCFAINRDTTIWILREKLHIFTVLSACRKLFNNKAEAFSFFFQLLYHYSSYLLAVLIIGREGRDSDDLDPDQA